MDVAISIIDETAVASIADECPNRCEEAADEDHTAIHNMEPNGKYNSMYQYLWKRELPGIRVNGRKY